MTGARRRVATEDLVVGDTILVRPGERVGADGRVLEGASEVDQATITGEPLPVAKETGDEVFAGTLNGTGALRVKVERDASDSVIARIVAMVEEASETKAPTQLFIEKVEQRYSLGMVFATLAVFLIPLAFGARPDRLAAAGDDLHDRGLTVRGGPGDHAAAALRHRQRRTTRRPGQVRSGDGASRTGRRGRTGQDRHPDRGHPPRHRHPPPVRLRTDRGRPAGAGGSRRASQRTPAGPRRRRRRPRPAAWPSPACGTSPPLRASGSPPPSTATRSRSAHPSASSTTPTRPAPPTSRPTWRTAAAQLSWSCATAFPSGCWASPTGRVPTPPRPSPP